MASYKVYKGFIGCLIGILALTGCDDATVKLSASEYSQIKSHLTRYGEFIGYLEGCAARGSFSADWESIRSKESVEEKLITPDEMQTKILESLEELKLSFDTLEKLDNIIREARNSKSRYVKGRVNRWKGSSYLQTCMTIAISAQALKRLKDALPTDPIKRAEFLSKLSPLR
jgi:hypothetical protein